MKKKIYNFSFTSKLNSKIIKPKNYEELKNLIKKYHTISGSCRSYGDSFIGNYRNISMLNFNKIINFDQKKGLIEVESGVILDDLFKYVLPKGFILDCSPGCKYVTVGGMISNNIAGKLSLNNSIINKIISVKFIDKNFKIKNCSLKSNKKLFSLIVGSKGKMGPIISTIIKVKKIKSDQVLQKAVHFKNYKSFFKNLRFINKYYYSVIWLNFMNKKFSGIYFFANHKKYSDKIKYKNVDFRLPKIFIYLLSIFINQKFFFILFNKLFKLSHLIKKKRTIHIIDFFFPQNKIINWNEVFKKEGFVQFHIYFNKYKMIHIIDDIKKTLILNNIYSNFAVMKFHNQNKDNLKLSLSLDIPIKGNLNKIKFILNDLVEKHDLEVNLSKDIILKKINNKTLFHNKIFNKTYEKHFLPTNTSNLIERLS